MDSLLMALRACAEPTRLRLLALVARGAFCVMDLVAILGQSQPRLSRHLRLLDEAGLLERTREGANVWLGLPAADTRAGSLVRGMLARLPDDDPVLLADRRAAARVLAERARIATAAFQQAGAAWDEARALGLDADAIETALLAGLPARIGRLIDIGTGTGRLLELLAPRAASAVGVDASRAMLALARGRLARLRLHDHGTEASVRQGDMYRLPFADGAFDSAVMHMLLHHAEDPAAAVAEAARVLAPDGRLVVIDLAPHAGERTDRLAHRHAGFSDATATSLFTAAGLAPTTTVTISGPLDIRLWSADAARPTATDHRELALETR